MATQTLEQFGKTIQDKYPQYKDLNPIDLGTKMLTKYPQYKDMVDTSSNQSIKPKQISTLDNIAQGALGFAKNAVSSVKGIGKMIYDNPLSNPLTNLQDFIPQAKTLNQNIENTVFNKGLNSVISDKNLQLNNPAQKIGGGIETVAELVIPVAYGLATKGPEAVKIASGLSNEIKNFSIGKDGLEVLRQIDNPEAQRFIKNGKTFGSVVDETQNAINKLINISKSELFKVKQSIPVIKIDPNQIVEKVNQGIMESLTRNASYRGIQQDVSLFKNPQELINSGLLDDNEVKSVKGMVKTIQNWGDNSARGILNLKEQLSLFYKEGQYNANSILSGIQNGLKDLVGEIAPKIKPALQKSSDTIDLVENLQKNLIGKNEITGETKLSQIARGLKNKAANAEKIDLVNQLEKLTGTKIMPKLQGYADYLELLKKSFPSKAGTIISNVGKRIGIPTAIAGGSLEALNFVKRLFGQ
jgi:hypothetical protein